MHGPGAAVDLVADIGGTNARFALVARREAAYAIEHSDRMPSTDPAGTAPGIERRRTAPALLEPRTLPTAAYASLQHAAEQYLADVGARPTRAAIAVASPVAGDAIRLTNRAWSFSRSELARTLRLDRLVVLNDFGAIALAIPALAATDRETLHGDPATPLVGPVSIIGPGTVGPVSIIGPGTGLGVALLVNIGSCQSLDARNTLVGGASAPIADSQIAPPSDIRCTPVGGASAPIEDRHSAPPSDFRQHWQVIETEGGHITFAPQGDEEHAIARFLDARYGRTSNERLLSGSGLSHIDAVLASTDGGPMPDPRTATLRDPATIVAAALDGHDLVARRALARFCAILGSVAGDAALIHGARTVMIAGGIVPRFVSFLRTSAFRERFLAKGRFAAWLEGVAVHVVTHPMPGLLGAAAALDATEPEPA
jgi:glucokinase